MQEIGHPVAWPVTTYGPPRDKVTHVKKVPVPKQAVMADFSLERPASLADGARGKKVGSASEAIRRAVQSQGYYMRKRRDLKNGAGRLQVLRFARRLLRL